MKMKKKIRKTNNLNDMRKVKIYSPLILVSLLLLIPTAKSQTWTVPEDAKSVKSTVEFSKDNISKGNDLYLKHCKSCHGDPGMNNPLKGLNPAPPDMAGAKMQVNTDGEMFFKISEGRGTMPQFKAVLAENERWMVISFIRSLNPDYIPETAVATAKPNLYKGVSLILNVIDSGRKAEIVISGRDTAGNPATIAGYEVELFAKRYFGLLPLGKAFTNSLGVATIKIPEGIKGDTFGNVFLLAKLKYSDSVKDSLLAKVGTAVIPPDIFAERSLWSLNSHTQWWIILSYLGAIAGVWITIFWVVFQLFRIYKSSKLVKQN
jgi:mono/diheme cytochrome c family protein